MRFSAVTIATVLAVSLSYDFGKEGSVSAFSSPQFTKSPSTYQFVQSNSWLRSTLDEETQTELVRF